MLCGGVHLCAKTAEKPYSKRFSAFSGIEKSTVILSKLRWTYGGVGGIRTLGRLLTVTRFPVVLVMTASIPLHDIGCLCHFRNSSIIIHKTSAIVKYYFNYFCTIISAIPLHRPKAPSPQWARPRRCRCRRFPQRPQRRGGRRHPAQSLRTWRWRSDPPAQRCRTWRRR